MTAFQSPRHASRQHLRSTAVCQSSAGHNTVLSTEFLGTRNVGPNSLLPVRRRGTLYRDICVILFTPPQDIFSKMLLEYTEH